MKPGDTVICINDTNWPNNVYRWVPELPIRGHYYSIRRIIPNIENKDGPPGVALNQIKGKWAFFLTPENNFVFEEFHFRMDRFCEPPSPFNLKKQGWVNRFLSFINE